jgi:hypothetical protein
MKQGSVSAGVLMEGFWRVRGGVPFATLGLMPASAAGVNNLVLETAQGGNRSREIHDDSYYVDIQTCP